MSSGRRNHRIQNTIQAEENNISKRRVFSIFLVAAVYIAGTLFFCIKNRILVDEAFCLFVLDISFVLVFTLVLMNKRLTNRLLYSGTNYRHIVICSLFAWAIMAFSSFLPDYAAPVMVIAFLTSGVLNEMLSLSMSLYLVFVFCLIDGSSIYLMLAYAMICILAVMLATYVKENIERRQWLCGILALCLNVFICVAFYYFSLHGLSRAVLIGSAASGCVSMLFLRYVFPLLLEWEKKETMAACETILDDEYSLVEDIRRFSLAEYDHARAVSRVAVGCAHEIGADEMFCACGAFYYRLGIMEGEPIVENGVKTAVDHCFPVEVVTILHEYEAKKKRPSTVESAIVHMTDAVFSRIESLDSELFSSDWNQNILIYQTLNELSEAGTYDDSGMGMNQFLHIREYLVHAELKNL